MGIFDKIKGAIFGHKDAGPGNRPTIPAGMAGGPQAQPGQVAPGQPAPQATAPGQPVNVEQVLAGMARDRGNPDLNYKSSIVDLMKLLGIDSSLENRKELAQELGYTGALDGSAEMNIWLHQATMKQLAASGGKVPASMTD